MLCSVFPPEETDIWDGSARFLSPCKFLAAHYLRVVPMVERLLHIYGKKLCDLEGADIVNTMYQKFAMMERAGVWAPLMLDTDADAMSKYVMGTAKRMILEWDDKRFEYKELSPDIQEMGGSVEEVLEREERLARRNRLRERVSALLASMGIDEDELYEYLKKVALDDREARWEASRHITALMEVCYATADEKDKLYRLLKELEEIKP